MKLKAKFDNGVMELLLDEVVQTDVALEISPRPDGLVMCSFRRETDSGGISMHVKAPEWEMETTIPQDAIEMTSHFFHLD